MKTVVVHRTDYYRAIDFEDHDPCGWIVIPEVEAVRLKLRLLSPLRIPKDAIEKARKRLKSRIQEQANG